MTKAEMKIRSEALRRYTERFDEKCAWRQREKIGSAMSMQYVIECTNCGDTDVYDVDLNAAVAYAMRRGWKDSYAMRRGWKDRYNHTLCPDCATLTEAWIEDGE